MHANWDQILPFVIIIGGALALGLFIKKLGLIGIIVVLALAGVWLVRKNPQWFDGLDGAVENMVEVQRK